MKFQRAMKSKGGEAPALKNRAPQTHGKNLSTLPTGTVINRTEYRDFRGQAETITELISELTKAKAILGDDCKWHGWDDGTLILETSSGVQGGGSIANL